MQVVRSVAETRELVGKWRRDGAAIGFVPTMGALHRGHRALMEQARRECDRVLVSIFVNPLQFGPNEDFERYPRREADDVGFVEASGADAVLLPKVGEIYPDGSTTRVHPGPLAELLEGARRPGHFVGVATVVVKLLNIAAADRAYFGQKDAQQVAVLRRVVADLDLPVEIVVCPTVRESDGLALSSRNAYLGESERRAATCLWKALSAAMDVHAGGGSGDEMWSRCADAMKAVLAQEPMASVDYADCVDPDRFDRPGPLAVLAVRVGATRLIDNVPLEITLRSPDSR